MSAERYLETIPQIGSITDYDRMNMVLYMRLLDATKADAEFAEVMQVLFGLDASEDPDRCRRIYDAHLARAEWMAATGYRLLAAN